MPLFLLGSAENQGANDSRFKMTSKLNFLDFFITSDTITGGVLYEKTIPGSGITRMLPELHRTSGGTVGY